MKNDQVPSTLEVLSQAEIFPHAYLPAAAAFCRRLKLAETINALVPSAMAVPPGLVRRPWCSTPWGVVPLSTGWKTFCTGHDVALLLGEEVDPNCFNDTTLGRSLDAIFQAGTGHILTECGLTACQEFALDRRTLHYDTSSVSVWGDYACDGEEAPPGPRITYGHSKDHRPDLKQFMLELLCVERGVPILGGTLSGNTSDKTSNNRLLEKISALMARHGLGPGAFVYVADSSLVTQNNLAKLTGTPFVSRLPFTYAESERVVQAAVRDDRWVPLGTVAEHSSPSRPAAVYRAAEAEVTLYGTSYRAVVVHSSAHDQRR